MQKRRLNRFALTGLAAAVLALGSLAPATPANANGAPAAITAVSDDGMTTVFEITTPVELMGQDVMLLQGPAPGVGVPVAMAQLGWGSTMIMAPSNPGTYTTAVSAEFVSSVETPIEID